MDKTILLDSSKIKQRISFSPHLKQQEILSNLKRFNVISGGKRVGKTILVAYLALKELLSTNKNIWIVAPTYDLAARSWDYLEFWSNRFFPDILKPSKAPSPSIQSVFGSSLELKSAENEKSLLGKPLDLMIGDEAARMDPEIWERYLRPNLIDRNGKMVLIGNPWGKNWFYDQFLETNHNPDYYSLHLPTAIEENGVVVGSNNPLNVSIEELQKIKATTPEHIWRQEYLANFEEGAGQVFRGIKEAIRGELKPPEANHLYFIGADVARLIDFTVLVVIDRANNQVVHFDRFKDVDWKLQKDRIVSLARRYNDAIINIDSTGVGDPITEDLKMHSLVVDDYKYSNDSKKKLIDKLAILISQKKIGYPNIPVLLDELESFSFKKTESGKTQYMAPSNKHDDCVNALALASWQIQDENEYIEAPGGIWTPKYTSWK